MKVLFLIIGLAGGFAGGVYWGVHHPTAASQLADQEERKFLELQVKISETIKEKLDQLAAREQNQAVRPAGSGFVSAGSAPASTDQQVASLRDQQDRQLQVLRQRLQQLSAK